MILCIFYNKNSKLMITKETNVRLLIVLVIYTHLEKFKIQHIQKI